MNKMILAAALLLAAFGVAGAAQRHTQAQHQMGQMMPMMQNCPMHVQGAKAAVSDTSDGVAVTITTQSGNVDELRRRAEHMAAMHSANEGKPAMMANRMIAASVKYEAVPNGAKLTFTPKDPAELEAFRKHVREHAGRMQKDDCSMMQAMMGGMYEPGRNHDRRDWHHPE